MTNDEKSTKEMQKRMTQYDERLKHTVEAQSSDLTRTLRDIYPSYVIDPEDKDPDFISKFTGVIDDA
jgi:hypothetical protein